MTIKVKDKRRIVDYYGWMMKAGKYYKEKADEIKEVKQDRKVN